jgi:predicted nucleic acid-binding protein
MPDLKRGFVDTNIWLYAFIESDDVTRHEIAKSTIRQADVVVSVQIINEICVNLLKKAGTPEATLRQLVIAFYDKYAVVDFDPTILLTASELREKYSLSFWDSLIVASALFSRCELLYSEDMQDGLVIDNRLTIVNPFKS